MKRIDFLQTTAALVGSSLLPFESKAVDTKIGRTRFAYLTDIHVKPDAVAEAGMAKAFQHVQSLKTKVDFIINGGDSIMDSLDADKQKTKTQWDLYHSILKKENSLSVYH
ncbi:MAG TPA: hypothetical protein VL946_06280, partial [Lacibacter sp.]|nr:hypothetical protein [Lacibacter sp.]